MLPHSAALSPNDLQRAIQQCKEQSDEMLVKACEAVEKAADVAAGGVSHEVLFEVARHWHELYKRAQPEEQPQQEPQQQQQQLALPHDAASVAAATAAANQNVLLMGNAVAAAAAVQVSTAFGQQQQQQQPLQVPKKSYNSILDRCC